MFITFENVPALKVDPVPPTLTMFSFTTVKLFVPNVDPADPIPTLKNISTVKSPALYAAPVPPKSTLACPKIVNAL